MSHDPDGTDQAASPAATTTAAADGAGGDVPPAELYGGGAEARVASELAAALARLRVRSWWGPLARTPILLWRLGLGPVAGQMLAVLTTTGRRSGLPRRTVVVYVAGEDRMYVVAVYGPGSQWFRNLIADPRVRVQTARGSRAMLAKRLTDDTDLRRAYADLERRLGRSGVVALLRGLGIPGGLDGLLEDRDRLLLVELEDTGQPAPPAVRADLAWVLPLTALVWAAARWLRRRAR